MSKPADPSALIIGQEYPLELPEGEGAVADFLRQAGHTLIINLSSLSAYEWKVLQRGPVRGGLLAKNGAILFIWQFGKVKDPTFTLDSPFDARQVHDLKMPKLTQQASRLILDVHITDADSGKLRGRRALALDAEVSARFLAAAKAQINGAPEGDAQHEDWMSKPPDMLVGFTRLWPMEPV